MAGAASSALSTVLGYMAESKRAVDAALTASREHTAPFFSQAHLKPSLTQSYSLIRAIIARGDDALEIALHQPPLNKRRRAISRHKLELIAWERTRQRERLPARSLER